MMKYVRFVRLGVSNEVIELSKFDVIYIKYIIREILQDILRQMAATTYLSLQNPNKVYQTNVKVKFRKNNFSVKLILFLTWF